MGSTTAPPTSAGRRRLDFSRTRWAAIGAAVAVSLGAGGFGIVQATTTSPSPMPIYTAINPCRLVDTRPAPFQIGDQASALTANQTITLAGTGAHGNCNVPAGVSSLAFNVTAIDATAPTFLQFAPGGTLVPGDSSSLNPVPGEPPTPNAVTVQVAADGTFSVYNLAGSVHMIIDIVGFFDDHEHTGEDIVDGSLTGADVMDESITGADVDDGTLTNADIADEPGIAYSYKPDPTPVVLATGTKASVSIRPPADGYVHVVATAQWKRDTANPSAIKCGIADEASDFGANQPYILDSSINSDAQSITVQNTFQVDKYVSGGILDLFGGHDFNLVCQGIFWASTISQMSMTATYFPRRYTPPGPLVVI